MKNLWKSIFAATVTVLGFTASSCSHTKTAAAPTTTTTPEIAQVVQVQHPTLARNSANLGAASSGRAR